MIVSSNCLVDLFHVLDALTTPDLAALLPGTIALLEVDSVFLQLRI